MERFFNGRNQIQIKNRWKKLNQYETNTSQCNHFHSESFQSVPAETDLYFHPQMPVESFPQVCDQKIQQEPYSNMLVHQYPLFKYLQEPIPPFYNHLISHVQIEAKQNHQIRLQPITSFLKEDEFNLLHTSQKFQTIQLDVL
jgi:hypothetical protein